MTHEPPPIGADWLPAVVPPATEPTAPTASPAGTNGPTDAPHGEIAAPSPDPPPLAAPTQKPAPPPASETPTGDNSGVSPGDAFCYGVLLGVVVVFLIGLVVVLVRENQWQEKESQWKKEAEVRQKK